MSDESSNRADTRAGEGAGELAPTRIDEGQLEAWSIVEPSEVHKRNVIHAGAELGVFDAVRDHPTPADDVIEELSLDPDNGYRLLRALANFEVMEEHDGRRFSVTDVGQYFRADHPRSLRGFVLGNRHPANRRAWTHLPDIVESGGPDGYEREFGCRIWEYQERNPEFDDVFDEYMTAGTQMLTPVILQALSQRGLSRFDTVCDVGGGQGYLLSSLLVATADLEGIVLDLPSVVEDVERRWAPKMGVGDRCTYVGGDMFETVPEADAYVLKHVLHDWTDSECVEILSTVRDAAPADARLFLCEFVVPEAGVSDQAKDYDIYMMVGTGGRERTEAEWRALLDDADWTLEGIETPAQAPVSVIEARKQ